MSGNDNIAGRSYTLNELMAVTVAREIEDGDLVFTGVGTAGRAFTLAVGLPVVSLRVAQEGHAPNASVYWGNVLGPRLDPMPTTWLQETFTTWPCASQLTETSQKIDMLGAGRFDISFESAAQVDRFGNLNITWLTDPKTGKRKRLIGCLAQPEHLAFVRKPIIMMDLDRRRFVEDVDYVTSFGYQRNGVKREIYDLPGKGPQLCITDKAVFDFGGAENRMRVRSLHPGVTLDDVRQLMGFEPDVAGDLAETPAPTEAEVALIREVIDPGRTLLRA